MLQKVSEQIAYCHQRARECAEKASSPSDAAAQRDYLDLERRWLMLAKSYELTERLGYFNGEVKRRISVLTPPAPPSALVPRVTCPSCGRRMRLAEIEPTPDGRHAEISSFECVCGFEYRQTLDRTD